MRCKTVLFLYDGGAIFGGIEALAIRVARALARHGCRSLLICKDATAFNATPDIIVNAMAERYSSLISHRRLSPIIDTLASSSAIDLVVALDPFSAIIASVASKLAKCPAVASNWVPDYFRFIRERPFHPMSCLLSYNYRHHVNRHTRLMMTERYGDQARAVVGSSIEWTLSPIPLELTRFTEVPRTPERDLIVTVARLDHMKNYLLHLPVMMRRLRDDGMTLRLHIYGEGPFQREIEQRIASNSVGDLIELRGSIAYSQLHEVYATAGVFVGMGTAALEAAASGVPTVDAEPYAEDGSSPGNVFHGDAAGRPCVDRPAPWSQIIDGVRTIFQLDSQAYAAESQWHREHSLRHDMAQHIALLDAAAAPENAIHPSKLFVELAHAYSALRELAR